MKNRSSRRAFLQSGLILPAAGIVIPPVNLEAAFQQPGSKPAPKSQQPSGYTDSGKYGKYVIKEPYVKRAQLESISVNSKQLMADCIMIHQVFYKPGFVVPGPAHAHDFEQVLGFLSTNPMNCRDFDAEVEVCLGEEQEKHIINVPTVISIAKTLSHGPITITKINKPFIFLEIMLTSSYSRLGQPPKEPKA
jgi:hypothetical protein